jgi:zinc transporter 1/2/3
LIDPETNQDGTHSQELEVIESVAHASYGCHDHSHAILMVAGTNSLSVLLKAYMMEISVAIHSIIIGIALGANNDPEELTALRAFIAAITFHQFFEGVGLGTVIEQARLNLGMPKMIIFALTFSLTTPIGIMIGIAITETNEELTSAQETTQVS